VVLLASVLMRLPLRTAVQSAASLANLSEFLFVLAYAGQGMLDRTLVGDLFAVATLSMLLAPWSLAVGPHLAAGFGRLGFLARLLDVRSAAEIAKAQDWHDHAIIAGYGFAGEELGRALRGLGVPYLVLDMNPENVRRAQAAHDAAFFGDVTSPEVLEAVGAHHAKELVLVINDPDAAARAVRAARREAPQLHIVVRTNYIAEVGPLKAAGADAVISAELEAAGEMGTYVLARHGATPEVLKAHRERMRS
jgi:CPA2 family monovalent cation:H+ antiporter-2